VRVGLSHLKGERGIEAERAGRRWLRLESDEPTATKASGSLRTCVGTCGAIELEAHVADLDADRDSSRGFGTAMLARALTA
jgi:hypothetical protein